MTRGESNLSVLAAVALLPAFAAGLQACSSTNGKASDGSFQNGGAGGSDAGADAVQNLGASYPCVVADAGGPTCVVGQSYCKVFDGLAGASGSGGPSFSSVPSCETIPPGSACAGNPTCACLCVAYGGCNHPPSVINCTCTDGSGFARIECSQI